jgi:hypothetical protein
LENINFVRVANLNPFTTIVSLMGGSVSIVLSASKILFTVLLVICVKLAARNANAKATPQENDVRVNVEMQPKN